MNRSFGADYEGITPKPQENPDCRAGIGENCNLLPELRNLPRLEFRECEQKTNQTAGSAAGAMQRKKTAAKGGTVMHRLCVRPWAGSAVE